MSQTNQVKRIRAIYHRASTQEYNDGMNWYHQAHDLAQRLARKHGLKVYQTAGVVAVLSPRISWERNVQVATLACAHKPYGGVLKANVAKATRILAGETPLSVLGGNKVQSFYECIAYPDITDAVCVDGHAYCVAEGLLNESDTKARVLEKAGNYHSIAEAYRLAARAEGITPHQIQAITWLWYRNFKQEFSPPPSKG